MTILLNLEKSFYHLKSLMDLWLDISGCLGRDNAIIPPRYAQWLLSSGRFLRAGAVKNRDAFLHRTFHDVERIISMISRWAPQIRSLDEEGRTATNACPWINSEGHCHSSEPRPSVSDQDFPDEDVLDWESDASTIVPASREVSLRPTEMKIGFLLNRATSPDVSKGVIYFNPTSDGTDAEMKLNAQKWRTIGLSGHRNHIEKTHVWTPSSSLTPVAEEDLEEEDEPETTETESPWPSIYSADTPLMDEAHHLTPFKKEFLEVVMLAFQQLRKKAPGGANEPHDGQPSSPVDSNCRGQADSSSNHSGKRPWSSSGSNCGSGGTSISGRSSKRRAGERRFTFACPFAKKDPIRYRECYHKILTRIRDVKQHITRCHYLPVYCPRCMKTFDDESARDSHIRSISCQEQPFVQFEGCSNSQRDQLSHRVSQKLPPEKQWYTVFDILFPGHPHPSSPLVDRDIFEPMAAFRDFMTDQGPTMMLEFFKSKGVTLDCQPQEERDLLSLQQTIIREGLEIILDTALPVLSGQPSSNDAIGPVLLQPPKPGNRPVQVAPTLAKEATEARNNQYSVSETQSEPVDTQVQFYRANWSNDTSSLQGIGTGCLFDTTVAEETHIDGQNGDLGDFGSGPDLDVQMANITHSDPDGAYNFSASAEWSFFEADPDSDTLNRN
ncbi:hypothetical protein VMCG_02066 [Cytospora schulzeri]|uniref:C2H2-type domain-containing protein n=1 Tax=Cytospora schulzeri TaxID=448051 RepID=A0A423X3T9_9PEZI|nr:hypothetical protein VMCG_02066 [Valsa malicola]